MSNRKYIRLDVSTDMNYIAKATLTTLDGQVYWLADNTSPPHNSPSIDWDYAYSVVGEKMGEEIRRAYECWRKKR